MPVRTQAQIAKARSALALYERFTNKAGWEITFVSAALRGLCRAGSIKTFQLDGNKVYWSQTADEQQAWRCVRDGGGLWVRLVAASPQPPTKLAASGLGKTRKRASSSP